VSILSAIHILAATDQLEQYGIIIFIRIFLRGVIVHVNIIVRLLGSKFSNIKNYSTYRKHS